MKVKTLKKKIEILEHAFSLGTGVYYSMNLTRDLVPGMIYQVIDEVEYCVNERIGMPENAKFSDLVAYWGNRLPEKEKTAYFSFFDISNLLEHYQRGEKHISHTYWTETLLDKPMFAEQHIIMYMDEENGDILGVTYILDQTEKTEANLKLGTERQLLEVICRDYTTVHYADLKTDIAEPLKVALSANASQISRIQLRKKASYTEMVKDYCDEYVADVNQKEFLKVMDRVHLLQALSVSDRFVYHYESIPNREGHRYFEVQVVRVREDCFDGNVIVAFRHIDDVVAIEQKYQRELEEIAYSDALTRMGNRAAFTKALLSYEQYQDAGCVVADVNNLKLCNDRYGHPEGDRAITDAAECIQIAFENIRGGCYRIGGDEFCVLIRHAQEREILSAIGQLGKLIAEKNKTRVMPLSIACGYSVRESTSEGIEQLFNRADEMMYDVKYRMKKEFPVYCEERIKNYLNVLSILSKSTDSFLFLWDIARDETWFFGDLENDYDLRGNGKGMNKIADIEAVVHLADRGKLREDLGKAADGMKKRHNMTYRWINRRGDIIWVSSRGTVVNDDKGKPFVMIGRVSDKTLQYMYHPLTKLFNKNKMLMDLKGAFLLQNMGYFMLLGIDGLSNINLRYGRNHGDKVIKRCAEILENKVSLRNLWHVENNIFALYLKVKTEEEVHEVYDQLLVEVSRFCTFSAGVVPNNLALFGNEENLYDYAKLTLKRAKNSGTRTIVFFSQEDWEDRKQKIQFLEEMQRSVENGYEGFYLYYQPQVRTQNYQLYAAEVLLRYHSEVYGDIEPEVFVPLLEESKLINQVGMWGLETALRQCREWRHLAENFRISVNFSAVQLKEKNIAEKVLDILAKTGMSGNVLTIEIKESSRLQGIEHFSDILRSWREAGIEISIDDFGTGYATMDFLKALDVNEIKIDRMFVRGVEEATYNYRFISNMVEFAKNNSIRICCEGVEDMRELAVLEELSPNLIQGYLFAKPCSKEEFEHHFLDEGAQEYQEQTEFIQKIYHYKDQMHVFSFNAKDILRKTDLGLWVIRINEEEHYYEMYTDETMERVLAVDRNYTPQECYAYWHDRIKEEYCNYVQKNVKRMTEADKVVQLEYPWLHPKFGEVIVRCSGRRVEDSDGMITLEGYHRIVSNIEQTEIEK